jgi:hypothetical protein
MTPMGLIRVESETSVAVTAQRLFDYVTTPALWHTWHPATVAVRGAPQRPLTVGEHAVELIAVGRRRDEAEWVVRECQPPHLWEIATETANGVGHIVYRVRETAGGCHFHRTLQFRSKRWPWRALDSSVTRWLLVRQSARALENLKRLLEAPPAA